MGAKSAVMPPTPIPWPAEATLGPSGMQLHKRFCSFCKGYSAQKSRCENCGAPLDENKPKGD